VRRHLQEAGYQWMPRAKNKKYTAGGRIVRKAFADWILGFTPAELKRQLHMSLDGIVLTVSPQGEIQRENFLHSDDLAVWRKPSERASARMVKMGLRASACILAMGRVHPLAW
jgi:hypothetical protein